MHIAHKLKQSVFLRHNAIFFIGSAGVGLLNYLYYPVLGRLMEPAAFGEVQTLVSLFLQFTIFLNVLNLVVVNIVVNYKKKERANRAIFELEKLAIYGALGLVAASVVFGPLLRQTLQFDATTAFTALALALLVSVPLAFRTGILRARQHFGRVSFALALGAGGKIVLSAALVVAGLSTFGAISGIIGAQLIALGYAAVQAGRAGFARPAGARYTSSVNLKFLTPELPYLAAVLGGSLSVMLLMSIDMLAAKYFFEPHTAGLYAGITTVARAIFFLTASVAFVLLPHVRLNNTPAYNRSLLLKSLTLLFAAGGMALAACVIAPQQIITILMGETYTAYADLLPRLALAMFIISILNLFMAYYLALRHKIVALIAIMGFVATTAALLVHHDSLRAVVDSVLLGSIITMCLIGIYSFITNVRQKAPHN